MVASRLPHSALGGAIGAAYGEAACLVVAALGFIVQATIITCSPVRTLRQLPAALA
ncbi:MAG: hypothetical protein WA210_03890 [Burkholderiaceae bacterium]